jgi:hypothetical protein
MPQQYYTLVASLPHLAGISHVVQLPITRRQLDNRLRMLDDEDYQNVTRIDALLFPRGGGWQSDELLIRQGQTLAESLPEQFREVVEWYLTRRTLLSAVRRRLLKEARPDAKAAWGYSILMPAISANWHLPDLGMSAKFPSLGQVVELLDRRDGIALDELLLREEDVFCKRLSDVHEFSAINVLCYVLRWNLTERWLRLRSEAASSPPSTTLIDELLHDSQHHAYRQRRVTRSSRS